MVRRPEKSNEGAPSGQPGGATPAEDSPGTGSRAVAGTASAATGGQTPMEDDAENGDHAVVAKDSRRLEVICATIAVAGSGALLLLARSIEVRTEADGIDPRWWPQVLGLTGLALGIILLVLTLARPPFSRADLEAATRQGWIRTVAAVGLTVVYILVWPAAGFLLATAPFLVAVTYLFGGRGWRTLVLFPVLTTAGIYLLFHTLLKVPL